MESIETIDREQLLVKACTPILQFCVVEEKYKGICILNNNNIYQREVWEIALFSGLGYYDNCLRMMFPTAPLDYCTWFEDKGRSKRGH